MGLAHPFSMVILALLVVYPYLAVAQDTGQPWAEEERPAPPEAEEQWLKTVWSQIDTLVAKQDYRLQETVVAAGVRGAEAQDRLLQHYYFKGGRRYSAKETLERIIAGLEGKLRARRRPVDRARVKYLTAICSDMLGDYQRAKGHYRAVVAEHRDSPYAHRASQRLGQLQASGR